MANRSLTYCIIALLVFLFQAATASAETKQLFVSITFPVSKTDILPAYGDNANQLGQLEQFLNQVAPDDIELISISGYASPEGSYDNNLRLSQERSMALKKYIAQHTSIPSEKLAVGESQLSWEVLRPLVAESQMRDADTVLALIDVAISDRARDNQLDVIAKMQELSNGATWRELKEKYFPKTRMARFDLTIKDTPVAEPELEMVEVDTAEVEIAEVMVDSIAEAPTAAIVVADNPEYGHFYLKTNGIGWAMMVMNIAAEIDLQPHWSITLPIYYSGFNYFKHTVKFRTFTVQPEVRYWTKHGDQGNNGIFIGAHLGLGYYNYATGGSYRVQDHDGRCPAWGGGLAIGYRKHLHRRWSIEFAVGAGVYRARYDKYDNDYGGQRIVTDKRRTWWGIDQAAVTIVYAIPWQKGGRK